MMVGIYNTYLSDYCWYILCVYSRISLLGHPPLGHLSNQESLCFSNIRLVFYISIPKNKDTLLRMLFSNPKPPTRVRGILYTHTCLTHCWPTRCSEATLKLFCPNTSRVVAWQSLLPARGGAAVIQLAKGVHKDRDRQEVVTTSCPLVSGRVACLSDAMDPVAW